MSHYVMFIRFTHSIFYKQQYFHPIEILGEKISNDQFIQKEIKQQHTFFQKKLKKSPKNENFNDFIVPK